MTSIYLKPIRGDKKRDGRSLETHWWAISQSEQVYKYLKNVTMPGVELLSLTFVFVSRGRGRACLKLVRSPCCKAALIGDTQNREEASHFYKREVLSLEDSKSILHLELPWRGLFNLCFGSHVSKASILKAYLRTVSEEDGVCFITPSALPCVISWRWS